MTSRLEKLESTSTMLLRAVVGSHAHGTAGPESDVDIRSVFLVPSSSLLSLDPPPDRAKKAKDGDENAWELGHFLQLCTKGSPSVLEVLLVEPFECTPDGQRLRLLFPHMLGKDPVFNAFYGYARSERQTFLSPTSKRTFKSMSHFLRVLFNGAELLRTGTMTVRIADTAAGPLILAAKRGHLSVQEIIARGDELIADLKAAYSQSPLPAQANREVLNQFLLDIRRRNW